VYPVTLFPFYYKPILETCRAGRIAPALRNHLSIRFRVRVWPPAQEGAMDSRTPVLACTSACR
jgi:hypothetical protein